MGEPVSAAGATAGGLENVERKKRRDDVWETVIGPALDEAMEPTRALQRDVPGELIHFTGAAALASILEKRMLRLSTVRAMNDPMEARYGIDLARRYVRGFKKERPEDVVFKKVTMGALNGELPDGTEHRLPSPHVCCFSTPEALDKVEHWALYGRGGSGFALVFDGPALKSRGKADLVPVVYKKTRQRELIRNVIELGRKTAVRALQYTRAQWDDESLARGSYMVTAHAFGTVASYVGAVAKRSEFSFEKEWRLLAGKLDVNVEGGEDLRFAAEAVGQVLRTFYEFPFESADLKAVIVGPVHADFNVTAVKDLIHAFGYPSVQVRVGRVALRTIAT